LFLFRSLLKKYSSDPLVVNGVTLAVFFATPVWHYGHTLFNEPFLMLFMVGAYYLAFKKEKYLPAGVLVALGMLIKPTFALAAVPLAVMLAFDKQYRRILFLGLPVAASVLVLLYLNDFMFGSPLRFSQRYIKGPFFSGLFNVFFALDHGIVPFLPVSVLAFACWPKFLKENFRDGMLILSCTALYICHIAWYHTWHGGWCFGPRYMVPIIPFLLIPLVSADYAKIIRNRFLLAVFILVCGVSVHINLLGAFNHHIYWGGHPFYNPMKG
jgi:hypothetical protein